MLMMVHLMMFMVVVEHLLTRRMSVWELIMCVNPVGLKNQTEYAMRRCNSCFRL